MKVLQSLDNSYFKLTLLPTEQCNFRCTYCYEDFELGAMPRPVINGLKALLTARAPELRRLDLHWFGGEPMTAFSIVTEICDHAQKLRVRQPHLDIYSSMTTNGYLLTPDRFTQLVRLGVVRYQISLDGYGEKHDRTRHRVDGHGTFSQIWENLLSTRHSAERDFSIMLRVHFSPSTLENVKELIPMLNEKFGDDSRYQIFFKAICRLGGPNNENIELSPPEWQEEAKRELIALVKRREEGVTDPAANAYVCYAAEPNSLVIRSNGQVAKCTVAFNDPRNQVGYLKPDGSLLLNDELCRYWFDGLESLDPDVLHCPLSSIRPYKPPLVQLKTAAVPA